MSEQSDECSNFVAIAIPAELIIIDSAVARNTEKLLSTYLVKHYRDP